MALNCIVLLQSTDMNIEFLPLFHWLCFGSTEIFKGFLTIIYQPTTLGLMLRVVLPHTEENFQFQPLYSDNSHTESLCCTAL